MELIYGDAWFRGQKRLTKVLTDEEARLLANHRERHAVVINQQGRPHCFLTISKDYIGVGFLDLLLREAVAYQFVELEPCRLFLNSAVYREFVGDTDKVAKATTYNFRQDGHVFIQRGDLINETKEEAEDTIDVSGNWEPYPEFGKYESISRRER